MTAEQGRFESPFVTAVLARRWARPARRVRGVEAGGEFIADLAIRGGRGEPLNVGGLIQPRSFRFEIDGVPVVFESITGSMQFGGGEGSFHRLAGRAAEWSFLLDGSWRAQAAEGGPGTPAAPAPKGVMLDLAITGAGIPADSGCARSSRPGPRDALDGISFRSTVHSRSPTCVSLS